LSCASNKTSSALFRSSMSVVDPYHLTTFPISSRSGTARIRNQWYAPSARPPPKLPPHLPPRDLRDEKHSASSPIPILVPQRVPCTPGNVDSRNQPSRRAICSTPAQEVG